MSSVFFKFKSQRDPQRVTFDGTGISVFELKREIINISRLGDGTDFDLNIYNEDTNEEYNDDTTIIPRSTSVVARRLPASKPGHGRAARYVSGHMPVNARASYKPESTGGVSSKDGSATTSSMDKAQTEEERMKAMFEMGASQWEQQKQVMSTASRVPFTGQHAKAAHLPDRPPPPGYTCFRCGHKGHWIQGCPTNGDPNYDNKPKVKRITGIPKAFLRTVEETSSAPSDGTSEEPRQPSSVMVNAEGDRVVAVPDQASWKQYQEKAQASAAQKDVAAKGSKELQDRGLECSIDKRMFVDPMKTPCCGTTYCNECIENALINSDLVCPSCSTEGVLLDNLISDEEMIAKIKAYEAEKKSEKQRAEKSTTPQAGGDSPKSDKSKSESPTPETREKTVSPDKKRKRSNDEDVQNDHKPNGPAPMQKTKSSSSNPAAAQNNYGFPQEFVDQMNALANSQTFPNKNANDDLSSSNLNPMNFMGMSMPPMMGMPAQPMMNPMMMNQWPNMANAGMSNMGMNNYQQWNMNPNGMYGSNMNGMSYPPNQMQGWNEMNMNSGWNGQNGTGGPNHQMNGGMRPGFQNQKFGNLGGHDDDNAYMRKPVNPHRHQSRQKKVRPTDYREL